jgi:two-component system, chemotaxis family, chemotaxis protein CheY
MKILIVDDDPISQIALSATLSRFGQCTCEDNGRDALGRFTAALDAGDLFDLIFLDIQMPIMDGQTALASMRALERERGVAPGREAKVIMITCHNDMKNVCTSFFQGQASHYFTKPIDMRRLVDTLRQEGLI